MFRSKIHFNMPTQKLCLMFRRVLPALLLALGVFFTFWQSAHAYLICCSWASNSATYKFHSSLPTGFQAGTNAGANVWTNVTSSSWVWSYNNNSGNLIKYGTIDGANNVLATTTRFLSGSTLIGFELKYDSSENWYTGSGTPTGNQYDLRSIAAHEFGHALGINHTQPNPNCPGGSGNATMCTPVPTGTTYARTLEGDDRNGVSYLYP